MIIYNVCLENLPVPISIIRIDSLIFINLLKIFHKDSFKRQKLCNSPIY